MKYKYKLEQFEVVKTHIPQDNDDSYIRKDNFKSVPGYEVFKLYRFFPFLPYKRPHAPEIRRESIRDVCVWLQIETGETIDNIMKKIGA